MYRVKHVCVSPDLARTLCDSQRLISHCFTSRENLQNGTERSEANQPSARLRPAASLRITTPATSPVAVLSMSSKHTTESEEGVGEEEKSGGGSGREGRPQLSPQEVAAVVRRMRRARSGNASAEELFNIFEDFYVGRGGVQRDLQRAFEVCLLAAKKGHKEAQDIVGDMYRTGEGVEQDYGEAFRWLKSQILAKKGRLATD